MVTPLRRLAHHLKAPRTQLTVCLSSLLASVLLWVVAGVLKWLELVAFVSHVSMAALVLSNLAGVIAALVALDMIRGTNLTLADRRYLDRTVERAVAPVLRDLALLRAEVTASHRVLLTVEQAVA